MKTFKTKHEIRMNYRTYGEIVIPAGVRCREVPAYPSQTKPEWWIDEFGWIQKFSGFKNSILEHDAVHYGIRIGAEDVEELGSDT